jgi:hypothetical protein
MTPLASDLLRRSAGHPKNKEMNAVFASLLKRLKPAYLFDCVALAENDWWPSEETVDNAKVKNPTEDDSAPDTLGNILCPSLDALLVPAPTAWIEYISPVSRDLTGMLLTEVPGHDEYIVDIWSKNYCNTEGCDEHGPQLWSHTGVDGVRLAFELFDLEDSAGGYAGQWSQPTFTEMSDHDGPNVFRTGDALALPRCLYAINSARAQHVAPAGSRAKRRQTKSNMRRLGMKFAGYTEIHLRDESAPRISYGGPGVKHSPRCLHGVRSFWRNLPNGGRTKVKAHKRGNASYGVKDSIYIVDRKGT